MQGKDLTDEQRKFDCRIEGKKRLFIYDPELMTFEQITDANTKFGMYETMLSLLPANADEYREALKRESLKKAYAALLIEVDSEGSPISYIYNVNEHPGLEFIKYSQGLKAFQRMELCKNDFFSKQGRTSIESIKALSNIMKEFKEVGVSEGVQVALIEAMVKSNSNLPTMSDETIIQEDTTIGSTLGNQEQISHGESANILV